MRVGNKNRWFRVSSFLVSFSSLIVLCLVYVRSVGVWVHAVSYVSYSLFYYDFFIIMLFVLLLCMMLFIYLYKCYFYII